MTNAELIDALRNCACIKNEDHCKICGYRHSTECGRRIADDAADAIERLTAEVDRKDKALQAWVTTWESADAHGEWIDEQRGRWIYAKCNLCGKVQDVRSNYCPNCGAMMKGENDEQTGSNTPS